MDYGPGHDHRDCKPILALVTRCFKYSTVPAYIIAKLYARGKKGWHQRLNERGDWREKTETASKGLQPHCHTIRGGNGVTLWTQSPKVFSGRHKVNHREGRGAQSHLRDGGTNLKSMSGVCTMACGSDISEDGGLSHSEYNT